MDVEGQRWMWESRIFCGGMVEKYVVFLSVWLEDCSDFGMLRVFELDAGGRLVFGVRGRKSRDGYWTTSLMGVDYRRNYIVVDHVVRAYP